MQTLYDEKMLNWICPKCKEKILLASKREIDRGWCSSCEIILWSPEKRKAFRNVIGAFVKGANEKEMNKKIDAALEHITNK